MAKPIRLNEEVIEVMALAFKDKLRKAKLSDGKVDYTQKFTYKTDEKDRVNIIFDPAAYMKMIMLIQTVNDEVAWHGTVTRIDERNFTINDIIVYPQVVTGSTVNTDQEEYQKWLMDLDDETANSLHMQGHSHVNMGVFASPTDMTHQEQILAQIDDDGFYIFMIWNKQLKHNIRIYDMANNTLYEDEDVDVSVAGGEELGIFLKEASDSVKRKTYSGSTNYGSQGSSGYGSGYGRGYGSDYGSSAGSNYGSSGYGKKSDSETKKGKDKKSGHKDSLPLVDGYDDDDDYNYCGVTDLTRYSGYGKS